MAINSVSYGPTFLNQSLLNLNNQLTTLQSQLTTGKKSTSYAGMGVNEGFAIASFMKNVRDSQKKREASSDQSERLTASGVMCRGPGAARRPAAV
jgi:hypothetical protein